MGKHPDSEKVVPFRRRRTGYYLPDLEDQAKEKRIAGTDNGLKPEELGFIGRYLGYADVLLNSGNDGARPLGKVIALRRRKQTSSPKKKRKSKQEGKVKRPP